MEGKADAFDGLTNSCIINVVACDGGDAALQVNGNGLHPWDGADDLFRVVLTMVAIHALYDVSMGLIGYMGIDFLFCFATASLIVAMAMAVTTMFMPTTAR